VSTQDVVDLDSASAPQDGLNAHMQLRTRAWWQHATIGAPRNESSHVEK